MNEGMNTKLNNWSTHILRTDSARIPLLLLSLLGRASNPYPPVTKKFIDRLCTAARGRTMGWVHGVYAQRCEVMDKGVRWHTKVWGDMQSCEVARQHVRWQKPINSHKGVVYIMVVSQRWNSVSLNTQGVKCRVHHHHHHVLVTTNYHLRAPHACIPFHSDMLGGSYLPSSLYLSHTSPLCMSTTQPLSFTHIYCTILCEDPPWLHWSNDTCGG